MGYRVEAQGRNIGASVILIKVGKNYVIDKAGVQTTLLLVTSIAFYKSRLFPRGLKWKVEEDAPLLKKLIKDAEANPTQQKLEYLVAMEKFYLEFQGVVPDGSTPEQAKEITSAHTASKACLMSKDLCKDGILDGTSATGEHLLDQPTIGDLVSDRRKQNGIKRFAWRKKKAPSDSAQPIIKVKSRRHVP